MTPLPAAAYSAIDLSEQDFNGNPDREEFAWLVQLGYHFPGTAWEIAARASGFEDETSGDEGDVIEYAFGINYYLNGHGNKLQLDIAFIEGSGDDEDGFDAFYPGYQDGLADDSSAIMLRFQWQLAL